MKTPQKRIPVAILGATGMVGQRLITLLADHPWFEIACLAASERSAGQSYAQAAGDRWSQKTAIPDGVSAMAVQSVEHDVAAISRNVRLVFCAIEADKELIKKIEEAYASAGVAVVSNNSAHRWTDDVPMIMPEVNPHHLAMIDVQRKKRGWKAGLIITKPNCSIQCYVPLLRAWEKFHPQTVVVSTYQAISGAGKTFETWPEMLDNVIPYIGGEEEKSEQEPSKVLANIADGGFRLADAPKISATCIRVPVSDGHMASVGIKFGKEADKDSLIDALRNFKNPLDELELPSAPRPFITYFEEDNRPQTRLDRDLHHGMGISVGRIRKDSVLDWKCVALSHNTLRGAASGSVLNAELLVKKGWV
jgi:aspartate-semialdehyde dehydrogenase